MHSAEGNAASGAFLLSLARRSIDYGFDHGEAIPVRYDDLPSDFLEPAATFTTLRLERRLRGCCGSLEPRQPLAADVAHSAFQAAFRDPRFKPLIRKEFDDVVLEVSVLSPMEPMVVADESDLLRQLRPGVDGLVIAEGLQRATFLPKVWEQLPEPGSFVAQLKAKCGLPLEYWSGRLEFFRYTTTTHVEPAQ